MCVSNRGSANTTFSMADLYRITAGRMNILNSSSRAYEMRMRPRNRWIRGIQITGCTRRTRSGILSVAAQYPFS